MARRFYHSDETALKVGSTGRVKTKFGNKVLRNIYRKSTMPNGPTI